MLLASGSGTLTQAVLDACAGSPGAPGVEIAAVGSDRPEAPVLARAKAVGVPAFTVRPGDYADRAAWDAALAQAVAAFAPDWVVSAGFMRVLGPAFTDRFPERIINTHPALLPSFPGAHAVRDALAHGVKVTGTTIHLIDAGVDTGPIIAQFPVRIAPGEDEDSLHERIRAVERRELVALLRFLGTGSLSASGRIVTGYDPAAAPANPSDPTNPKENP